MVAFLAGVGLNIKQEKQQMNKLKIIAKAIGRMAKPILQYKVNTVVNPQTEKELYDLKAAAMELAESVE